MGCLCSKNNIKETSNFNIEEEYKSIQNQNNENSENPSSPEHINPVFLKNSHNNTNLRSKNGTSIINFNNNEDPLIYQSKDTPEYLPNNTNDFKANNREENPPIKKLLSKKKFIKNLSKMTSLNLDSQTAYNSRALHLLNEIRKNPPWYAEIIKNEIKNIKEEIKTIINKKTFIEEERKKIYYEKKVKVLLNRGKSAFEEAVKFFSDLPPMSPLEMKDEICIPLPTNFNETFGGGFFKSKVNEIRKDYNLNRFFVDNVKNPEVGILLMMVDDYSIINSNNNNNNISNSGGDNNMINSIITNNNNKNNENKSRFAKRDALLNREYKYIGIDNKFIDKKFVAVYSFSK